MKLYYYDHCPFCTRARMAAALCQVEVDEVVLQNDDEETPIKMIGAKQVPILQKPDGSYMGESLEIVKFFDGYVGGGKLNNTIRTSIQEWADMVMPLINKLTMPRDVKIAMPEFASQAAIDYFVQKKQEKIGNFAQLFADTADYLPEMESKLSQLAELMISETAFNGEIGMEDILVFPLLRKLSMVKALQFPEKIRRYMDYMSHQTHIPLFFERAL